MVTRKTLTLVSTRSANSPPPSSIQEHRTISDIKGRQSQQAFGPNLCLSYTYLFKNKQTQWNVTNTVMYGHPTVYGPCNMLCRTSYLLYTPNQRCIIIERKTTLWVDLEWARCYSHDNSFLRPALSVDCYSKLLSSVQLQKVRCSSWPFHLKVAGALYSLAFRCPVRESLRACVHGSPDSGRSSHFFCTSPLKFGSNYGMSCKFKFCKLRMPGASRLSIRLYPSRDQCTVRDDG